MYPTFDLNPPVTDWIPMNYHTIPPAPEPNSLVLLLLGGGMILLKRRRP